MTDEELLRWKSETFQKLLQEERGIPIDIIIDDGGISGSKRIKTMSKNWFDDEIDYISDNGDIHLHPGVHRLKYNTHIKPEEFETHINEIDLKRVKTKNKVKELYTKEDGIGEY